MNRFSIIIAICLMLASGAHVEGQTISVNPKFGSVSDAELDLKVYAPDTSAAAILLYKSKEVKLSFDNNLDITRKVTVRKRYKVLKENGRDCADIKIVYLADRSEKVIGVKVSTYNSADGKVSESKLSKKLIFDEKYTENLNQVSFSAPDVKVGSVIEVQYEFSSARYHDVGVEFLQEGIPVNCAEYSVSYADYFLFNKLMRGSLACESSVSRNSELIILRNGSTLDLNMITDSFRAVDIPAFKRESHCFYPDQFRLAIDYDLRSINIPGFFYRDYSTTWEKVDEIYVKEGLLKEFGRKLRFASEIEAAAAGTSGEEELIAAVRAVVCNKIRFNDIEARFPDVNKAVKEGVGNSADLNAAVACALNGLGYKAEPVLFRDRTDGLLVDFHVSLDAYSGLLTRVTTPSGKVYFADFSCDEGYLNVLPSYCLVSRARVIDFNERGTWVDLQGLVQNNRKQNTVASFSSDGTITGKNKINFYNQAAWSVKSRYNSFSDKEDFISGVEKEEGIEVDGFNMENADKWSPDATVTFDFSMEATTSGDLVYIKPFFDSFHSADDFKNAERYSPVDFAYAEEIRFNYILTIPEDYVIEELPKNAQIAYGNDGSRAMLRCQAYSPSNVVLTYIYTMKESFIIADDYPEFRSYWEQMCAFYNSTIVLRKK